MLEILSHQYLKKFVKSYRIDWDHIYSFGRIISKCIENNSTYLINSEIFSTKDWIFAILIPLFLSEKDSTLVLNCEKIRFLREYQIQDLKNLGFNYIIEKDQIIFKTHRIYLITLEKLLNESNHKSFKNHRFIFSGIEDIKKDLKNHFRISICKQDWLNQKKQPDHINQYILSTYNFFKKKFFLRMIPGSNYVFLEKEELNLLTNFFSENSSFSNQFSKVSNALSKGWACWVKLDNTYLDWSLYLEPIDELAQIRDLLIKNKFVFLSAFRKDLFFEKSLKQQNLDIDLVINFKSNFMEKKITLYVPSNQILPNNPRFSDSILDRCNKLIIFRKGLTLLLCDDIDLKFRLATELASKHGKRVLLEKLPSFDNEILCSSYDWWIKNSYLIKNPEQIIIPLLPIPNMSEPINFITVGHNKKLLKDWFREFLLPEALEKLERSISPLRKNSGKLIILDGRVNQRKWGRLLLQNIQPSKQINYMLPFD